jgi:hypothetical protein
MRSNASVNLFLYIMDQWLKKGSSNKQLSTTTVSTGVPDGVSESQRFTLPSSINSSRTAESSKKWKYNNSYLSLGFTYTGDEIAHDALCVLCSKVLPNSSVLPAKLCRHCDNHPAYNDKDLVFSSVSLRH